MHKQRFYDVGGIHARPGMAEIRTIFELPGDRRGYKSLVAGTAIGRQS